MGLQWSNTSNVKPYRVWRCSASLGDVYRIAKLTADNTVSLGASLEHVHVPGRPIPAPSSELASHDEVEVGMGIHNEPGSRRMKATLEELVRTMLVQLLDLNDEDRAFVKYKASDKFVLLINNLGGISTLELSGITAEVSLQLEQDYQIKPLRTIQGTFLTSLNGMGFSVSLLRLADTGLGPGKSLVELLDAPSEAVGWAAPIKALTWDNRSDATHDTKESVATQDIPSNLKCMYRIFSRSNLGFSTMQLTHPVRPTLLKKVLTSGLNRLIAAEDLVTRYDTIVGDGDCGIGLKRGAEAVLSWLNDPSIELTDDVVHVVDQIIPIIETSMDGTSGALYAIFLNALVGGLRNQDSPSSPRHVTAQIWAHALQDALKSLAKYTPAQPGDRTLVDALEPFVSKLAESGDIRVAAKAADAGMEATKGMKASLGRAVYVGSEEEWVGKVPDPGAYGLSEFLTGLAEGVSG